MVDPSTTPQDPPPIRRDSRLDTAARPSDSNHAAREGRSNGRDLAQSAAGYSALANPAAYARFLIVAILGLTVDLWSKSWAFHTLGQGNQARIVIPHVLEFQTMLNHGALFGIGAGQTTLFLVASACALLLVFWMFAQSGARSVALHIALGGILAGALGNMYDRITVKLLDQALPSAGGYVFVANAGSDDQGVILKEYPPDQDGAEFRMRVSPGGGTVVIAQQPRGRSIRLSEEPAEVGFVRDYLKIPTRWFGRELWPWVFNVADMLLVGGVAILAIHLWRDRKQPAAAA